MKLFRQYLATKKKLFSALAVFAVLFFVSFVLFRLPLRAVLYPALLCLLTGGIFLWADFLSVRAKHEALEDIRKLSAAMIQSLPEPSTVAEADYGAIVCSLRDEAVRLEQEAAVHFGEMTDYYTVWAHQIKTPIASMKLTLQNEDTAFARKLRSDLFRIEQYVEMVLAFLRLDSVSSDYVFRQCSLDAILCGAIKKFAPDFIGRKLRLEYDPAQGTVLTDEKWLSFVVEQILSNALKYTREGGIHIYMPSPERLCIRDTGIGIAPEDLPRIFEKGYTGRNGRVDKSASGIGLYLCRRICRNLGIEISAQSKPGEGTEIQLDFSPLTKM